jgi:hypothetical protein
MEENLQLEETLKTSQQAQDKIPYDPNASARYPDGYTPVGFGEDNTPVENVSPIRVGEIEVSTSRLEDIIPQDLYGYSGDNVSFASKEISTLQDNSIIPIVNKSAVFNTLSSIDISFGDNSIDPESPVKEVVVDPPVDPPEDPEDPPVEPPLPPVDPPEDPEDPPVEPPLPPVDPPEDPPEDPEDPGKGNPGNDKEVGNSPWDGETGASDNPGKGNHQDGQDPEPNQPPGDSKNDGGQNNDEKDPPGNGGDGGKPENHQDNGWGNGDDDAPGNSLPHNNAENDQSPSGHYDDFVSRFIEENPVDDIQVSYNWEQDNTDYLDYTHQFDPHFDYVPELPHFDNLDLNVDHFDHPM